MPGAVETFRTQRLAAERLRPEHLRELHRIWTDPQVAKTLAGVRSAAEVEEALRQHLAHWDAHGFGLFIFRDPETDGLVGYAGLRHVEVAGRPEVELLYALLPERWGQGLATEMAQRLLEVARELGLEDVVCFTLTTNRASQRVMEKGGFRFEARIEHAGLPHVLYRLAGMSAPPRPPGEV